MPENSTCCTSAIDNHSVNIYETSTIRKETFGTETRIDQTIAAL